MQRHGGMPPTCGFVACLLVSQVLLTVVQADAADERRFTGLTHVQYQAAFDELVPQGYRPTAIRGYAKGGQPRYDLTMSKGIGGSWSAKHGRSTAQFNRDDRQAQQDGFTRSIHTRFKVGGKTIHAAVWVKKPIAFHTSDSIPETGRTAPSLAPLDEMMRRFVREHDMPGASLAVAKGGRLLYARGFGYADVKRRETVQPRSQFRVASISKPITAVAIMQLAERGKLKLDDRAFEILDVEAPAGATPDPRLSSITIRQLLQHNAGWDRDASFDPMFRSVAIAKSFNANSPAGPTQIIKYMSARPLDFAPGEKHAYSNFGYCVLGRVIERVSGRSYEDYVKEQVLAPLRIRRMRIGASRDNAAGEVTYYTRSDDKAASVFHDDQGKRVPLPYGAWYLEAMDAHGGWVASTTDLVRFALALDDTEKTRIVSSKSVATMFAPPPSPLARDKNGKLNAAYYAAGWNVRPVGNRGVNTWHSGILDGTSGILVRRFDGFCWAVLFNIRHTNKGGNPISLIDPLVHQAVDKVQQWPR